MPVNVEDYYIRYGPMVLRRCRYLLKDEDKALDAMQEVFVKLLVYQDKLKDSFPSSLLYRIATNICLNIIRSDSQKKETMNEDLLSNIARYDDAEDKLMAEELLDEVFKGEKKSTREIAVMHYVDGMTLQQVADAVGMSMSGVRKRLRNLKNKVKELEEFKNEEL